MLSIAVVCEAPADQRTACGLADRVVYESADWITPEVVDDYRQWRGFAEGDSFLRWTHVPRIAKHLRIRAHGHFEGQPGAPDAAAARLAMLVLNASDCLPDAIVLVRDDDRQTERRRGLEQARQTMQPGLKIPIVVGVAHVMRENWVIAGFMPLDDVEQLRLDDLRSGDQLGFDPTLHPERLTAKTETAKLNSKRVLKLLVDGDKVREMDCWTATPLDHLRQRGAQVGLADYLAELKQFLVPLFTG